MTESAMNENKDNAINSYSIKLPTTENAMAAFVSVAVVGLVCRPIRRTKHLVRFIRFMVNKIVHKAGA